MVHKADLAIGMAVGAGLGGAASYMLVKQRSLQLYSLGTMLFLKIDNTMVWLTQEAFDSAARVMADNGYDTGIIPLPESPDTYCPKQGIRYLAALFSS